jgi:hypothetical protein
MLVGNTEDLFAANADDLHLPAQAASASHRIAFGGNAGKPVRRLRSSQALWPSEDDVEVSSHACINVGGYSVHAATAVKSNERDRLEKLVRYMVPEHAKRATNALGVRDQRSLMNDLVLDLWLLSLLKFQAKLQLGCSTSRRRPVST